MGICAGTGHLREPPIQTAMGYGPIRFFLFCHEISPVFHDRRGVRTGPHMRAFFERVADAKRISVRGSPANGIGLRNGNRVRPARTPAGRHGDDRRLDVILAISNSGETREVAFPLPWIKRLGLTLRGETGDFVGDRFDWLTNRSPSRNVPASTGTTEPATMRTADGPAG